MSFPSEQTLARSAGESSKDAQRGRRYKAVRLLIFCALAMAWAVVIALAAAVIWLRRVLVAVARMTAAWIRLPAHVVRRG